MSRTATTTSPLPGRSARRSRRSSWKSKRQRPPPAGTGRAAGPPSVKELWAPAASQWGVAASDPPLEGRGGSPRSGKGRPWRRRLTRLTSSRTASSPAPWGQRPSRVLRPKKQSSFPEAGRCTQGGRPPLAGAGVRTCGAALAELAQGDGSHVLLEGAAVAGGRGALQEVLHALVEPVHGALVDPAQAARGEGAGGVAGVDEDDHLGGEEACHLRSPNGGGLSAGLAHALPPGASRVAIRRRGPGARRRRRAGRGPRSRGAAPRRAG